MESSYNQSPYQQLPQPHLPPSLLIDFIEGYTTGHGRQPPLFHAGHSYNYERESLSSPGWQFYRCPMKSPYCKGRVLVDSVRIQREDGRVVKRGRVVCGEHNHPPTRGFSIGNVDSTAMATMAPTVPSDSDLSISESGSIDNRAVAQRLEVEDRLTCLLCNSTFPKAALLAHIAGELGNFRYECSSHAVGSSDGGSGKCGFKSLDYYGMLQHQLDAGHKCEEKVNKGKEWLTQLLYTASCHGRIHGMEAVYGMTLTAAPTNPPKRSTEELVASSSKKTRAADPPPPSQTRQKAEEGLPTHSGARPILCLPSGLDDFTCHLCGETGLLIPSAQRDHFSLVHGDGLICPCPVTGCRWKGARCKNTVYKHLQRTHNLVTQQLVGEEKAKWEETSRKYNTLIDERMNKCFPNFATAAAGSASGSFLARQSQSVERQGNHCTDDDDGLGQYSSGDSSPSMEGLEGRLDWYSQGSSSGVTVVQADLDGVKVEGEGEGARQGQ